MEYLTIIIVLVFIVAAFFLSVQRHIIYDYQRGLLYRRGKFLAVLQPGEHFHFRFTHTITRVDVRAATLSIPGQEVLSLDNVGLKISLAVHYKVSDPFLAVNKVLNYHETLYLLLQLNLREIIASLEVDDILARREEINTRLHEKSKEQAAAIGVELLFASVKDVMFPGDLKNIFAQVVHARKEGLAALERARGESAALRNLANAASALENNPGLLQLRMIQAIERNPGHAVIVMPSENNLGVHKQSHASS